MSRSRILNAFLFHQFERNAVGKPHSLSVRIDRALNRCRKGNPSTEDEILFIEKAVEDFEAF
jgi:hypothetical protein